MSASLQQFFNETEAVCQVLSELVGKFEPRDFEPGEQVDRPVITEEDFTAVWQAVELLARAITYIGAQVNAEAAKTALLLPPIQQETPKTPKAARLYDSQGKPLA